MMRLTMCMACVALMGLFVGDVRSIKSFELGPSPLVEEGL